LNKFVSFKEKPDVKTAEKYIADGHYGWNPGYWILDPNYYLNLVKRDSEEIINVCETMVREDFSIESSEKFAKLEKISADYLFAEKVSSKEALVLIADIGWSDVGEWISLKEALEESKNATVSKGNAFDLDSKDSIIYNLEEDKLVATIGLNGMVVVNTKDAIAVFPKEDNNRLKEFLKLLEENNKEKYL
jgi:mannose-1-phosphate guanylyltransferase